MSVRVTGVNRVIRLSREVLLLQQQGRGLTREATRAPTVRDYILGCRRSGRFESLYPLVVLPCKSRIFMQRPLRSSVTASPALPTRCMCARDINHHAKHAQEPWDST